MRTGLTTATTWVKDYKQSELFYVVHYLQGLKHFQEVDRI